MPESRFPAAPRFVDSGPQTRELESDIAQIPRDVEQRVAPIRELRGKVEQELRGELAAPAPQPPHLEQVPEFQPRSVSNEEKSSFMAISMALAGLGSALTRQGITGALSSAASAMNGYSEGNYQQAQFDLQNFKAHAESVIQRNNQVQSEYRQILESRQYSLSQKQNLLRVLAAREHDEVAMAMLRQNNLHALFDLHSKRIDAMNRFQLQAMSIQERMSRDAEMADIRRQLVQVQAQRSAASSQRVNAKQAEAQQARSGALQQIDRIAGMALPATTGVQGFATRWWEDIAPQLGYKVSSTPANDFAVAVEALQGSLYKQLVGPGNVSKTEWARINNIIKGVKWNDNPATIKGALEQVKQIILNSNASTIVQDARWAIEQGAPRDAVIKRLRERGIENPEAALGAER